MVMHAMKVDKTYIETTPLDGVRVMAALARPSDKFPI